MLYSSPEFLVLLAGTLALYGVAATHRLRFLVLLVSSLLFYAWAGVFDALVFAFVVAISWLSIFVADRLPRQRTQWCAVGITVMALHLFFWKYGSWFVSQVQLVFPRFLGGRMVNLPLPVGISFFTLQGIAYVVDYARGEARLMPFGRYLLFKSFFPQLVAGPIVRYHQLLPQIEDLKALAARCIAPGLNLFCVGFAKKMLLADKVAPFVDTVFADAGGFNRWALLTAVAGYTVQIWADFSGYTDMGRGVALMFGINLPENFLSPYFALKPSEFWRRWHITLSQWIRDYIYIPLGGARGSRLRVLSVAVLTMAISGLWHGANWTFVLWGLYHGALLVIERTVGGSAVERAFRRVPAPAAMILRWSMMLGAVMLGWLIFRAPSLRAAASMVKGILLGRGT